MKVETVYTLREIVKTEKVVDGVTITLSQDEAKVLYAIAGSIGGRGPVRDLTNALYSKLNAHFEYKTPTNPFEMTPQLKDAPVILR